jgi:hypothetical protein
MRIAADGSQLVGRFQVDFNLRMRGRESPEARHEPACRERRFNRNPQP